MTQSIIKTVDVYCNTEWDDYPASYTFDASVYREDLLALLPVFQAHKQILAISIDHYESQEAYFTSDEGERFDDLSNISEQVWRSDKVRVSFSNVDNPTFFVQLLWYGKHTNEELWVSFSLSLAELENAEVVNAAA